MDWFKKHTDTVIVLGGILGAVLWMNHQFSKVETDIVMIKTVLIMQRMMPPELATYSHSED